VTSLREETAYGSSCCATEREAALDISDGWRRSIFCGENNHPRMSYGAAIIWLLAASSTGCCNNIGVAAENKRNISPYSKKLAALRK
jgi:hypothetical protein